ncbi:hypothetical protein [Thalassomonas haliotis]|uniref:Uncharacterized protein n=1 Tax=Thalassomonas haliotis TaxID=485448 RepID=A0ABY7VD53_9GAMM|nr:hypothetical protein [Thalassomonas haliotis]WDE10827.1 hypothetical protein H3N35_21660 [Thalassomonas haliotis]
MKYIFDLYWFNHGGRARLNIQDEDFQTAPDGGWANWTARHNVKYMLDMIADGEDFMLVGDKATLKGQARNAGKRNTRCMVGAEVLLLDSAGYKLGFPPPGNEPCVFRLCASSEERRAMCDQLLIQDAILYLNDKRTSHHFWNQKRKNRYLKLLG